MKHRFNEVLVELKPSSIISGEVGVFALKDIKKGQNVCPSKSNDEDFISKEEFNTFSKELQKMIEKYAIGTPDGFFIERGIDFNNLYMAYFINHSCDGNLGFDGDDEFITIRDISIGEELSYDYGLIEANPQFKFNCHCGAPSCRKIVTGLDWKNPDFQKLNKQYIHPDLRKATL